MDELIAADHDADMRGAGGDRAEEHQVAGLQPSAVDVLADAKLLAHLARHRHAVLLVDVANESAAVEAVRIHAAVSVRGAAQGKCGA